MMNQQQAVKIFRYISQGLNRLKIFNICRKFLANLINVCINHLYLVFLILVRFFTRYFETEYLTWNYTNRRVITCFLHQ